MDKQDYEKENQFLKELLKRNQSSEDILIRSVHELTQALVKSQQDYAELKQKYEALLEKEALL